MGVGAGGGAGGCLVWVHRGSGADGGDRFLRQPADLAAVGGWGGVGVYRPEDCFSVPGNQTGRGKTSGGSRLPRSVHFDIFPDPVQPDDDIVVCGGVHRDGDGRDPGRVDTGGAVWVGDIRWVWCLVADAHRGGERAEEPLPAGDVGVDKPGDRGGNRRVWRLDFNQAGSGIGYPGNERSSIEVNQRCAVLY